MKYLVIARPRGNLPPDRAVDVLRGTKEWLAAGGGVGVANADSHEASMRQIRENPAFPFTETEVHPLVDINQSLDSAIQVFQKMVRSRDPFSLAVVPARCSCEPTGPKRRRH